MRYNVVILFCFASLAMRSAQEYGYQVEPETDPDFVDEHEEEILEAFFGQNADEHDVPGAAGLLQRHGYSVEIHNVETADGYILQLEHIIGNEATMDNCVDKRRPVLMVHGLFDSSVTWVVTGPNDSLAIQLTDLCYDVWLGNCRGNRHSRRHRTRNPDGRREERQDFWSFSWHQIGQFDLPAMIDYVLQENGQYSKLLYVGHSQGTTSFLVMASIRPEYNRKVQLANLLAPVVIVQNARGTIARTLARLLVANRRALHLAGRLEFLPGDDFLTSAQQRICARKIASEICQNVLFLIFGYNPELANRTALNDILMHAPAGAAVDQVVHYGQLLDVPDFRQYDFGTIENLRRYRSPRPPTYNLRNINAPIALYYSNNDLISATQDVDTLARQLPNVVFKYLVRHDKFNHLDFVWSINLRYWLNDRIIEQIEKADAQDEL